MTEDEIKKVNIRRSYALLVIGLVVLIVTAAVFILVRANRNEHTPKGPTPTAQPSASIAPSVTISASPSPTVTVSVAPLGGYVPLWPFEGLSQVEEWQRGYRVDAREAWHLDPDQTALAFVHDYLGFTELNKVTTHTVGTEGAHIGVGYRDPNNALRIAGTLHLLRFGAERDAPWEVVGTDDTTLSLTTPSYGAKVTSPITVGGKIIGVDENIVVVVRQLGSAAPVGNAAGVPAGGQAQPWSTTVQFTVPHAGALTIVARTGGHLQGVERFAITGAWTG